MVKTGKIQKKGFFGVTSDLTATKIYLYASSEEELNGKIVKIDLTRSLRGKSLELKLRVKTDEEKLSGEPISIELMGSYIRRAFRKGSDYVEDSFVVECKDAKAIIKPFMLTRNKVSRAVRKRLREVARNYLIGYAKTCLSKEIFTEIMTNKIQRELSLKLKKVYPLVLCEIRVFEILNKDSDAKVAKIDSEQEPLEEKRDINAESKEEYLREKAEKKEKAKEENDSKKEKRVRKIKEAKEKKEEDSEERDEKKK